jgi:hypothetical protein
LRRRGRNTGQRSQRQRGEDEESRGHGPSLRTPERSRAVTPIVFFTMLGSLYTLP